MSYGLEHLYRLAHLTPQNACEKCGYNCINNSVGGSQLTISESDFGYCLSYTINELEEKFRPKVISGEITEEVLNAYKECCYENSIIPYIDGTNALQASMIIIDHGYNDRNIIYEEMQDEASIDWESRDRTKFVGAMNYLLDKIFSIKPFMRVVIAGYFQDKLEVYHSSDICKMQELVSKHFNLPIMKAWEYTQINGTFMAGTSNYLSEYNNEYGTNYTAMDTDDEGNILTFQVYCPDRVHPHTDRTGNSNIRLNAVYTKLLRDLI